MEKYVRNIDLSDSQMQSYGRSERGYSIQHNCNDSSTFPMLITFNQRLTFHDGILDKKHPGYVKPGIPLKTKKTLRDLINDFNPNENLDKIDYDNFSDRSSQSS